jgi:hypothetical protein
VGVGILCNAPAEDGLLDEGEQDAENQKAGQNGMDWNGTEPKGDAACKPL